MKYIIYLSVLFFFYACSKEDDLSNSIDFSNTYVITDDPNDPVQHERYMIFKEFDVSVYFNDTINKVYIRDDIYGNPIYKYELLDIAWTFFNDASQSISGDLEYEYIKDQETQLKNLEVIRKFLEATPQALQPTLIFAVEKAQAIDGEYIQDVNYKTNFRGLLWTALATKDELTIDKEIIEIQKGAVSKKIENYTTEISKFGAISDPGDYGRSYLFRFPGSDKYGWMASYYWWAYPQTLWGVGNPPQNYKDWLAKQTNNNPRYDSTYVKESTAEYCKVVGVYGFVRGNKNVRNNSPADVSEDLGWYLELMLMYSPEEFKKYWGNYPLVMAKYDILYDVLVNKLGIKL